MLKDKKYNIAFILFIILIIYLIFPKILYYAFVFPLAVNDDVYFFGDWSVILSAIECKLLGYDTFVLNPCDFKGRRHVYGSILLYIPYFKEYVNFYSIYIPIFFNIIFISIIVFHFNLKKISELILCFLFIISPSALLAMERFNIDILIFLLLILSCYSRSNFLNLAIISSVTLAKFYPIVCSVVFFFKGKNLTKFCFFGFFVLIIFIFLYLELDNLKKIYVFRGQFTSSHVLSFSVYHLLSIPLLASILSDIHIILLTLIFSFIFFIFSFSFSKKMSFLEDFSFNDYKNRLFFLGSVICVAVYFVFSNYYYREIFLFFLIPYLLSKTDKNSFIKYLIYFFIGRHIFFLFSNYFNFIELFINIENTNIINVINGTLAIKAFLDLFLISTIFGILVRICINLYNIQRVRL